MNAGIIFFLMMLGFGLGFVIASWLVFTVVKNRGTIIGGQLITDDLTESAFLAFAVRINKHNSKTYRVPQDLLEARRAFFRPKQWQKDHEREIIGKPIRIGIFKVDGKLIPYLHYSFKKITVKEDTVDALILEAFTEPKIGLAIEGTCNEIETLKADKRKGTSEETQALEDKKVREEAKSYLKFLRNSYDKLLEDLEDERSARIVLREQIMPMAQVFAAELLGIDIDNIAQTIGLPTYDEIIAKVKTKPLVPENIKDFEKLQEGIQEKIVNVK